MGVYDTVVNVECGGFEGYGPTRFAECPPLHGASRLTARAASTVKAPFSPGRFAGWPRFHGAEVSVQGYFAYKKPPPP